MENNFNKYLRRFVRYICRTYKNKLAVIAMIWFGWFTAKFSGDGTFFMLMIIIGIPMFITRMNIFYKPKD